MTAVPQRAGVRPALGHQALRRALSAVAALSIVMACANGTDAPGRERMLRIAAASDLRLPLADIVRAFSAQAPDVRVEPTFAASGTLFAQIANKAPFDLFLSADLDYPRRLVGQGLGEESALFEYALGRLSMWVGPHVAIGREAITMAILANPSIRHVAIANPRTAPYGRAAEAALRTTGLWEAVSPKLVLGDSVSHAASFVESGAADAGLLSATYASSPASAEKGRHIDVPPDAYPPIEQGGLIVPWGDQVTARAFRDFLLGAEGQGVLRRYGFAPPRDRR